jgi:hypothetical protein
MFESKGLLRVFLVFIFFFATGFTGGSDFQVNEFIKSSVLQGNKIEYYSGQFLGNKYGKSPLGEGTVDRRLTKDDISANYDRDPLYRFDKFDCMTFVETVLALSVSNDFDSFKRNMNGIRYKSGEVSFLNRNHFMALDWIPNNYNIVVDITSLISKYNPSELIKDIDKQKWFKKNHGFDVDYALQPARISYIPINKINYKAIPSGSIINIVRPFTNVKKSIGTNLLIFHTGFAIRKNGELYFRHASSRKGEIVDEELKEYLKQYRKIDGVNVLRVIW